MSEKTKSILCLYDIQSQKETVLAEFDGIIEAPFFENENTLMYNTRGLIYRFDIATRQSSVVNTGYCNSCNNDHVLSPDGSFLAVSHHDAGDHMSRVYLIDLIGGRLPLMVTTAAPSYLHGFSPDGKELAYCACRNGDYDVYVIPTFGGEEKQLTCSPGLDDGPEYSMDGQYIYFNSVRDGNMNAYRMGRGGENVERLTHNGKHNWFPHISPDCQKIAYICYDPAQVKAGDHPANKDVEIRIAKADGSSEQTVLSFFGGQGSFNVNSWAPDSQSFAFIRYEITA